MYGNPLWWLGLLLLPLVIATPQPPLTDEDALKELVNRGFGEAIIQSAAKSNSSRCAVACQALEKVYPESVATANDSAYTIFKAKLWSAQQGAVNPACIFSPSDTKAISSVILLSRATQCQFAVKCGGHAAFAGGSNIEGGITINLQNFKQVSVSADKSLVDVGGGNIWYDVYATLEKQNLTVIGGRVNDVGVGGLTLGGGISFFSNMHGWACDNVASYELVDANGRVLDVSQATYPDLYWALRGGGNNFGIITKFTLNAYPQGLMWGGNRAFLATENASLAEFFGNFAPASVKDPKGALTMIYAYSGGTWVYSTLLEYADPVPTGSHPAIFDEIYNIPSILDDTKNNSLSNITLEVVGDANNGFRETYWATTYKLDKKLIPLFSETYKKHIEPIVGVEGLLPIVAFQPITEGILKNMQRNGGNPIGLSVEEGPYFILNVAIMWFKESDDAAVMAAAQNFNDDVVAQGKALGLHVDYIYMNYASHQVDVIAGYGKENQERLRKISQKYDQTQVFQKLQPGYFKL